MFHCCRRDSVLCPLVLSRLVELFYGSLNSLMLSAWEKNSMTEQTAETE